MCFCESPEFCKLDFPAPILISSSSIYNCSYKWYNITNMAPVPSFHSLHVGEDLVLVLGFGISSLAVCARVYTKMILARKMLKEDCKFIPSSYP